MDFIYSIQICEISHQTFGPSHRKCPTCPMIFVNTASVTLTFDLWPWPFARTSLLSLVITPENFMMIQWQEHSEQGKSEGFDSCDWPSNLTQIGFESSIFQPVWPLNLMDDPKNNRAPLLYYIKLCASFQIHQWIKTGSKSTIFFSRVTLRFDGWPWKTIGLLFYATSSFVHHFVAIGEFKVDLQSGNAQFGSNWTIFWAVWP